ncbi:site-2 protease family protein [bacterium]|nr:site-2 protease family protein [bacterium]
MASNCMQEIFFGIAILIMSVVVHEVSHGYVADILGDPTARFSGRLTLNPISHLDPFGSVILPLLTFFTTGFIFGWAKPVPYNPYNLQKGKYGPGIVALAGPMANFVIAIFFALFVRFGVGSFSPFVIELAAYVVLINLLLGFFNLIPIPPLDGSKVVASFLPYNLYQKWSRIEAVTTQYSLIFLFLFVFLFFGIFSSFIQLMFSLLVGFSF